MCNADPHHKGTKAAEQQTHNKRLFSDIAIGDLRCDRRGTLRWCTEGRGGAQVPSLTPDAPETFWPLERGGGAGLTKNDPPPRPDPDPPSLALGLAPPCLWWAGGGDCTRVHLIPL